MSDQFVMTTEQDNTRSDTRRWVCPNCGHQEMRSDLDEQVRVSEEVSYHKETVTPPTDDDRQQQQQSQ